MFMVPKHTITYFRPMSRVPGDYKIDWKVSDILANPTSGMEVHDIID